MPEETQQVIDYKNADWANAPIQTDAVSEEQFKQIGGVKLVLGEFDNIPGAKFYVLQFADIDAITSVYGPDTVLKLVNAALNSNLRVKARNKLPEFADEDTRKAWLEKVKANGELVLSELDAINFVPGDRELTAAGYQRLARQAKAAGKIEEARMYLRKAMQANERELAMLD